MQKLFSIRMMALAGVVALGACDTPVSPDDHDDHEAVGAEVQDLDGNVIATFEDGAWTFASGDAVHMHPGDELEVEIFFIAEDGDRFQLPQSDADYTLRVVVANPAVVTYTAHGDHGDFAALAEGETTAIIQVYHGTHEDWQTDPGMAIEVVDHPAH